MAGADGFVVHRSAYASPRLLIAPRILDHAAVVGQRAEVGYFCPRCGINFSGSLLSGSD